MINQSRRNILKGMGYGLALSATGISTTALALSSSQAQKNVLPTCDITIYQQQSSGKEIVSLINVTDQMITLNAIEPVGLEHVNGALQVNLNNISARTIKLKPGERFSFEIEAISTQNPDDNLPIPNVLAGHIKVSSDHSAFNGIIPVTIFDHQIA